MVGAKDNSNLGRRNTLIKKSFEVIEGKESFCLVGGERDKLNFRVLSLMTSNEMGVYLGKR